MWYTLSNYPLTGNMLVAFGALWVGAHLIQTTVVRRRKRTK